MENKEFPELEPQDLTPAEESLTPDTPAAETTGFVDYFADILPEQTAVKVKVDSGALTSSMHATNLERFKRDGKRWVRYDVDVKDADTGENVTMKFERPLYRQITVRGAGGEDHRLCLIVALFSVYPLHTVFIRHDADRSVALPAHLQLIHTALQRVGNIKSAVRLRKYAVAALRFQRHTQRFKKRHRVLTAEAGKYAVQKPTVAGNIGHQLVH